MNKPTEKSSSRADRRLPRGLPHVKKSNCAHTRSTSNAVALMDRMWKIGYKQNVS